jgi:sugar phosphate isomerase/epimerase
MVLYRISFQTNCYAWIPHGYVGLYPGSGNTLDYALRNLAQIGYDGVEVDCLHILDTRLWEISKTQRRILKNSLQDLGIEVEAFSAHTWPLPDASFTSSDKESKRLGMEWTKRVIDLAADFDTKVVTTHIPSPRKRAIPSLPGMPFGILRGRGDGGRPRFEVPEPSSDDEMELMVEGVGECVDYCSDRGVLLAIEEYAPMDFWKNFIKEIGSPALKINLHLARVWRDMYHANGVIEEPSLPRAVRELGSLIVHTHCMDYKTISALPPLSPPTKRHTVEVIPGAGECDYIAFIKALKEINYTGYLTIESHRSDILPDIQAAQALQSMRRLIQQAA